MILPVLMLFELVYLQQVFPTIGQLTIHLHDKDVKYALAFGRTVSCRDFCCTITIQLETGDWEKAGLTIELNYLSLITATSRK